MRRSAHTADSLEGFLWKALDAQGVGLVGLTKSGLHPSPAIVFVNPGRGRLWLAVESDSELVRGLGGGGAAIFTAQGAGYVISITGNLIRRGDVRRLTRLWNPLAQAWRPEGPGDPQLVLLSLDCVDAEMILQDTGLARFSWDIGRNRRRPREGQGVAQVPAALH